MYLRVRECTYKGFPLKYEEGCGWKVIVNDFELLYPTMIKAQKAIDLFYERSVSECGGRLIKKGVPFQHNLKTNVCWEANEEHNPCTLLRFLYADCQ